MAGTLIALESTNQQLLDKTAKYLALKLQSEGKTVEVMGFPQKKQSSSHFVESHQKGEYGEVNPYAASMFYILDRYDASPQIKQFLEQNVVVICKSYRGTSLAKLGSGISDASVRKGFYIWADSLESGTFSVPRPDMAIVLSEELPTLYELCELFPKDYIYAIDPTKVRNMLNALIPPAPAINKKPKEHILTWHDALACRGKGQHFNSSPAKGYAAIAKKSTAHKLYADGLHQLEALKEIAIQKLPAELAEHASLLLTPLGSRVTVDIEPPLPKSYKNRILQAQVVENFEPNYGEVIRGATLLQANPRNELDSLSALMLPKTELGIADIEKALNTMPYVKKAEIFKAYLAGVDNQPTEYPLAAITMSFSVLTSYVDALQLAQLAPTIRFSMQPPTPRWGYAIPEQLAQVTGEIENCFLASLKLHSQLETAGEHVAAQHVVLTGNYTQCLLYIDGTAARLIVKAAQDNAAPQLYKDLSAVIAEKFPILATE